MRRWWPLIAMLLVSLACIPLAMQVEVDPGTSGWIDAKGPAASALKTLEDARKVALETLDVAKQVALDFAHEKSARDFEVDSMTLRAPGAAPPVRR